MLKWIIILVVLVIIGFLGWKWYQNMYKPYNVWIVKEPIQLSKETSKTIDYNLLKFYKPDGGYGFSINGWIKMNNFDLDYGKEKMILGWKYGLYMGFDVKEPTLKCFMWTVNSGIKEVKINNFPLQRWVHIAINVFQDSVDLWQDGKLVDSVKLENIPYIVKDRPMELGEVESIMGAEKLNMFKGYISKLKYCGYTLTKSQIEKNANGNPESFSYLDNFS